MGRWNLQAVATELGDSVFQWRPAGLVLRGKGGDREVKFSRQGPVSQMSAGTLTGPPGQPYALQRRVEWADASCRGCWLSCIGVEHSLANAVGANGVSVIQDACQGLAVGHMYQKHKVLIPHCRTMRTKGLN